MKNTIIVPLGNNLDAVYLGIKELVTEKVILLVCLEHISKAEKIRKDLEKFQIHVNIKNLESNSWEEVFRSIGEIKNIDMEQNLIVNVGSAEGGMKCAATCATFVNGIRAFDITENNEIMFLPVLKFSYYNILTEKKLSILKILYNNVDNTTELYDLSKKLNMSLPLISYHINGTSKSDGLKTLGLVDTKEEKGKLKVRLNTLGLMILKGYIK
ncbi:MAG: DUF6293 family protein [Nanoarchaeota archaeon]